MSSLLNVGSQALSSNQTALSYTGQNIANVNTEGYSRQRVNFTTQQPPILGVEINDIQRITDQFLVEQVWRDQSALSSNEQQVQKIGLLDQLLVSEATSLSTSMDSFFESLQRTVNDPLFIANRQLFLAEANSLVSTFQNFDSRLADQQTAMTTEVRSMVASVNGLSSNIAQLNVKIGLLDAAGQNYNALLDERSNLIKQISELMSVNVVSSDGGVTANVTLSNGESIVIGGRASVLSVKDGDPDPLAVDIMLTRGSQVGKVTDQMGSGSLGGLFSYRDNVLQPTVNEIGRLAIVFSDTMNEQHRQGMDLNGVLGEDLFKSIRGGDVFVSTDNKTTGLNVSVNFFDSAELNASNYTFEMTGLDSFMVTRESDGKRFESSGLTDLTGVNDGSETAGSTFEFIVGASSTELRVNIDGFTFSVRGPDLPANGDQFLIKPTQGGTRQMDVVINNPRLLALASPIRVTPNSINGGNAELVDIQVTDSEDTSPLRPGQLEPPMEIVFNADGTFTVFDISEPAQPTVMTLKDGTELSNLTYQSGAPIEFDSFSLVLQNQPNAGDRFKIEYNTNGFSDNRNALKLSQLQIAETIDGFSYQDTYGQILAKVGAQSNSAQISYSASMTVLVASENAVLTVSGVNLDEEATKLIQYQQAYTAATRLISTYQTIFDSLIAAVR